MQTGKCGSILNALVENVGNQVCKANRRFSCLHAMMCLERILQVQLINHSSCLILFLLYLYLFLQHGEKDAY